MRRLRSATAEPVLGSLITYYGLRHITKKGQAGAAKVMYLAAMAYNLKKYLRFASYQPGGWGSCSQRLISFVGSCSTFATATAVMKS